MTASPNPGEYKQSAIDALFAEADSFGSRGQAAMRMRSAYIMLASPKLGQYEK
jgi:hypothetical protein